MKTLRELVDDLPTQSLDLFVQHYEAGEVGGFYGWGGTRAATGLKRSCYCPRAALGFDTWIEGPSRIRRGVGHPAERVEIMANKHCLDTAELYTECILAIQERDAALTPTREAVEV